MSRGAVIGGGGAFDERFKDAIEPSMVIGLTWTGATGAPWRGI